MNIRRAGPEDISSLVAFNAWVHPMHVAAHPERYRDPGPDALAAWYRDWIAKEGSAAWIAEHEGVDAGFVLTVVSDRAENAFLRAARTLVVDQLAVRGDLRRAGVGRALMAHAERLAADLGCEGVELTVIAFNAGAVAFYESLGYGPLLHRMVRKI